MLIKKYDYFPEEAKNIRTNVFINEQGFQIDFDEIDDIAEHLVLYDGDEPAGTCRYFFNTKKGMYAIGRLAVEKRFRKKNYGADLIRYAEEEIQKLGYFKTCLSAQVRASSFYEKQGYHKTGDEYMIEFCPHIWMVKELKPQSSK